MIGRELKAWLLAHGYSHASGIAAGQVDYRRLSEATGYKPSHLKAMVNGWRPVSRRIEAFTGEAITD